MSRRPFIGVIGEQECAPEMAALAERVGEALARRGAVLVCGGMGGVMEAAARGQTGRGLTVGILPGAHRSSANPFIDVPIVTNLGEARNSIVVRSAQAIVAVGGSYGTLSEIAFALKLGIPVVGLSTWRLDKDGHGREGFQDPIVRVGDPETAVETALRLATQYPETIP